MITNGIPSLAKIIAPPVDGVCGASNGMTLTSAPTSGLCSVGIPSAVSGTAPWSWNCSGVNGGAPASCHADIQTYQLTVTAGGSGAGSVAASTGGISFAYPVTSSAFALLPHGAAVTLTATAQAGSTVTWTGDCDAISGTPSLSGCSLVMAGTRSAAASFACPILHVKNTTTMVYYDSVLDGYGAAGSGHVLQLHAMSFTGDLALANPNAVVLKGGFDCAYETNDGAFTSFAGMVTISANTVTLENIIIR